MVNRLFKVELVNDMTIAVIFYFFFFIILRFLYQKYSCPTHIDATKINLFCNTVISLTHSTLMAILSTISLLYYKEALKDMLFYKNTFLYQTLCISTGYFMADVWDHMEWKLALKGWDILLHHIIV
ncbi:hypothetical protein HZS_2543 [Henneguya salminicola]|nr:hypothetical protein HZS_2543 [Henneguya salminicola]